jgi:rRNA maturation RNase YbeY
LDQNNLSVFNVLGKRLPLTKAAFVTAASIIEKQHHCTIASLEVVVVDEAGIIDINTRFLNRSYVTDIITFAYHENVGEPLEGTLYLCLPRIREQAREFNQPFRTEFLRVFVHGVLHLCGFDDGTPELKAKMHAEEDKIIGIFKHAFARN